MSHSIELGNEGEDLAVQYLIEHGFEILERKWKYGHKEIDIIAAKQNIIHIVEVKLRSFGYLQEPMNAVTITKQQYLIHAANGYLLSRNLDMEISFDIVSIVKHQKRYSINLIQNAFYPIIA